MNSRTQVRQAEVRPWLHKSRVRVTQTDTQTNARTNAAATTTDARLERLLVGLAIRALRARQRKGGGR